MNALRRLPNVTAGLWLGSALVIFAAESKTIVPESARVDDLEARLTYARILSYRRETWDESIATYQRVLRDAPQHVDALTELAEMHIRRGEIAAAEQQLRLVLDHRPEHASAVVALSKVLLWRNRLAEALQLLESTGVKRALTAEERAALAEVFTRLGRHADANTLFDQLLAMTPSPTGAMLSAAADARLASGDVAGAVPLYRRALELDPELDGAKRGYALTLAWSSQHGSARTELEDVLKRGSNDPEVIHAYLRAVQAADGRSAAIEQARVRAQAEPANARWRAEWAELEAQRGYAVQSRQLFAEALKLDSSPAYQLQAARAAISWGDFTTAERVLRDTLRRNPADRRTRDELGRLLVSVDRVEEAEQHYRQWLFESPTLDIAWLGLVRLRLKEKNFSLAWHEVQALLQLWPNLPEALQLKAETLMGLRRFKDAGDVYALLIPLAEYRFEAELARGRAAEAMGDSAAAQRFFTSALAIDPTRPSARFYSAGASERRSEAFLRRITGDADRRYRGPDTPSSTGADVPESAAQLVEWAGLYAEQGNFAASVRCLKAARIADLEYYPARSQLAEFLAIEGQFDAALAEFAALRRDMPSNRQVMLGEARTLAWSRRYNEALRAYAALADLNFLDPVPRREAARTAGWAKLRDRAAELYATAWRDEPVDGVLAIALRPVLDGIEGTGALLTWQRWAEAPRYSEEPFHWTERFAEQRLELRDRLPPERRARLERIYLELLPALRLQRAWWLEDRAKRQAWDRRYDAAEFTFQRLLASEPANQEALFDLSQVQAAQGLGDREKQTLERLLHVEANHRFAAGALRRREIRSRPMATAELRTWREQGRGELSSLENITVAAEVQGTFRHNYVGRVSVQHGEEMPQTRDETYDYRAFGAGAEAVFNHSWRGSVGFLHRKFEERAIGHADSGHAQLWWERNSHEIGIGYERREELTNEFALFQGIRSDNGWIGASAAINRKLSADARLVRTRYSDNNDAVSALLRPAYIWTDHPRVLKTILTLEYRDTDAQTVYVHTGGRLVNLVFPYWTPQNYTRGALTLEWYHDLAREFFVGAQEHNYDVKVTFGTDSESNPSLTFEADWRREWKDRWLAWAALYFNESREWDAFGLRLRLARRF